MSANSPYLGSTIQSSGRAEVDVDRRLAQAFKAFRALRKAVFGNKDLTLQTKRAIYRACVLSVLLYVVVVLFHERGNPFSQGWYKWGTLKL